MIELDRELCTDLETSASAEWLEANGIGGYAMGTVSGIATRRYHGLLAAATRPPLGRAVLLARFEEALVIGGDRFELSANRYPGTIQPEGYKFLTAFRLDPWPVWTFEVNGVIVEKSLFMIHGENTTVCRWQIMRAERSDISFELKPFLAFRDHHHLRTVEQGFETAYGEDVNCLSFHPDPAWPTMYLHHNAARVEPAGYWYRDFEYSIEQERGFDYRENLYQPCSLTFDLSSPADVAASTKIKLTNIEDARRREGQRRDDLITAANSSNVFDQQLVLAADQFIVSRGRGKTVIAGYPWFSDWGRDTMIALPGLTLATGRPDIARSILLEFSKFISEGMLPNRFPDEHETPDYNTVDATLWYFEAIRAYLETTNDIDLLQELYPKLADVIDWHVRGSRFGIHVDTDGLLYAGEEGQQLTWMDAKIDGHVVTSRIGKPVEIQALWYNALCIMAEWNADSLVRQDGEALSDRVDTYRLMAANARDSFNALFWNDDEQCVYDVVNDYENDASIRPNQIFAVSLHHSMLDQARARKVVEKVEAELLTPFGLRTLSPRDPAYRGRYEGGPAERDSAYHQGTVWAWLIGPFIDAYRKTHSNDKKAERRIAETLAPFRKHLAQACVGQVSEIFDGDPPHHPKGAPAQAWSVAEVLRAATAGRK
ncbi:MAG: glycogen debranching enzyme family protein [Acidobacteria bacterium]|nr:glycogen debranching enzyme family protein [Acidobacteriota bacterium]